MCHNNISLQTGSYHCAPVESGLVKCKLDNPLVNTTGDLHLVFKPSGLQFRERFIDLFIWANTTSEEIFYDDNRAEFRLEVKKRAEVYIKG